MPKVYNKRKNAPKGYSNPPADAVYVGRPSDWGNPFRVGRDGTRAEVIAKFESYALAMLKRKPDWLEPLRGKDLICWCAPESCHADVLLRLANDTSRSFVIRSNQVNKSGFRVVLCEGDLSEDGTIDITWIGNKIIDERIGKMERLQLCEAYASMEALLSELATENVRYIYWQDTKEYQYINKE